MRVVTKLSGHSELADFANSSITKRGSEVVRPHPAKVALGSTGSPYLTNLAEVSAITAVISSLGQVPQSRMMISPATSVAVMEPSAPVNSITQDFSGAHQRPEEVATPTQWIINLSQVQMEGMANSSSVESLRGNLKITSVDAALPIQSIGTQVLAADHFSLMNAPVLTVLTINNVATPGQVRGLMTAANDPGAISGIGTLISNTPVSTLASLGVQNTVASASQADVIFDGITVSGQAESIDIYMVNTRSIQTTDQLSGLNLTNPQASSQLGNLASSSRSDVGFEPVAQQSMLLILIASAPTPELFIG